jgi:hypothetical protein
MNWSEIYQKKLAAWCRKRQNAPKPRERLQNRKYALGICEYCGKSARLEITKFCSNRCYQSEYRMLRKPRQAYNDFEPQHKCCYLGGRTDVS